ncbi:MAG: phosphoenolpyruvate carboxykinase (ATP) [Alphaproteobacteria bacterium]|nr:phosphoenolpyruvate carboxykinase (ATP) [Alphaproteobacteria bacterium]
MIQEDVSLFVDARELVTRYGVRPAALVYRNPSVDVLYQAAVQRGQGRVLASGVLHQATAPYFGRAAKSSFYVNDSSIRFDGHALDELMSWGDPARGDFDNLPIGPEVFERLHQRVIEHLSDAGDLYVVDGWSGRTPTTRLGVRVVTARAPSALFAHNIFLRADTADLVGFEPGWTILHAPSVKAEPADGTNGEPFVITHLGQRLTLIGGTAYHGQIKKAIFCVQNLRLPLRGVLTMHAGASEGNTGMSAIHAGLSGTGKTTLSNTGHPVADDQIAVEIGGHGDEVVSNLEGGQYAKTDKLRREKEPETWDAIRYGTTAENLWVNDDGTVDFDNDSITANGRVGYPLEFVPAAKASAASVAPANVTFLTADGFGVLPPVSRLSVEGGMIHFACGFTSKMPGTELGVTEPMPTFSDFFGKPFMPLKPIWYMDLFAEMVRTCGTEIWLVNTGWLGPAVPGRERVDILVSKAIINAIRDGRVDLSRDNFWYDPVFKLNVPRRVPGVDADLLDPRRSWDDPHAYRQAANKLAAIFQGAIAKLEGVPPEVLAAGPAPVD